MFHTEYIEYLKRENKSNFDEFRNYYIHRKLRRFIQINKEIIDKKISDKKKRNNEKLNYIIVHTEEDFNLKSQEVNNKESVHLLILENENRNLIWQKSKGPISDLNDFIINKDESCLSIEENKILGHNEKVLIISAEPGMGKSLILEKLVFDSNSEFFCLKIILSNFTEILSDLKENPKSLENQENILDFTLTLFKEKQNELEISILKHLAQEQKLILMFDGVDEVVDYKEQVKQLIKLLRDSFQFKMIIITTRNHLKTELEDFFHTISFSLNHIDADEQINFLKKYWRNLNLKSKRYIRIEDLEHSAKDLVDKVRSSLNSKISEIIGIPLQTKMIADIYFDKLDTKEDFSKTELTNMADLYDKFVEKMFNIQFEDKNQIKKKLNEKLYFLLFDNFNTHHIYLSSLLFFGINQNIEIDQEEILKYGLIVHFRNEIPIFLHQSYAEYFLAKSAFNKLEKKQDDEEINLILQNKECVLVRNFLEGFFQKIPSAIKTHEKQEKNSNSYEQEIENCCEENLFNILNYLIENKSADIKSYNKFLCIASECGHFVIVQLLIEKGIDINQTDKDGRNALHSASRWGHTEIIQILIEKGIDINQTEAYFGRNALHLASEYGNLEIVQLLIEKGIDINQTNKNKENALHLASWNGHKEIVELLIEKGIDINQTDKDGSNALHLVCENGRKEIAQILIEKGIDINKTELHGSNALHWASQRGHKEIVLLLIEKGIDINQTDSYGQNALYLAIFFGHREIAQLLIEKGIDINKTNLIGKNALEMASIFGQKEIVPLIVEKGKYEKNNLSLFSSENGKNEKKKILKKKKLSLFS